VTNLRILFYILGLAVGVSGCAEIEPKPYPRSQGHIDAKQSDKAVTGDPPAVVTQTPVLPEPEPETDLEKYTVVVNEVPVKEILFALARDADLNVDIYPGIDGTVTLNAVDQTLPQILDRISRQADVRYELKDNNIIISPDKPFFKSYEVDYVNMSRTTSAGNQLATQISTTGTTNVGDSGGGSSSGGGGNNSTTDIQSNSNNLFWSRLVNNIAAIIDDPVSGQSGDDGDIPSTDNIVATPEAGRINVRATSKQHEYIQEHIADVVESAQRQVVIQATIVEVELTDQYQAGINWQALDIAESSISVASNSLFTPLSATAATIGANATNSANIDESSLFALQYDGSDLSTLVNLLEQFGNTKVLSSPQLMVLNNQTAMLKAVQNLVYFEVESDTTATQTNTITSVDSQVRTVPVGVVMAVTPQISDSGVVTLNIRPTVTDDTGQRISDPAVALTQQQIGQGSTNQLSNSVPVIRVREMESMLRLNSGQTAVLGGLMRNRDIEQDNAVPGLSKIPLIGKAFESKRRSYQKSELVIFLRPTIINNPSIEDDLRDYKPLLEHYDNQANSSR